MKRDNGLKPRERKNLPTEKLLDIFRGIYPDDVAQEFFRKLTKDGDKNG